jgi:hypothetical protein
MKAKFRFLLFIGFFSILYGCKTTATLAEINELKEVVAKNNFEFSANSANPVAFANVRGLQNLLPPGSSLNNINLAATPNYLRISKDSIQFDLPYYGERQIAGGYNDNIGLQFDGLVDKSEKKFNDKKISFEMEYSVKIKTESLKLNLTLYANNVSKLFVTSSHRTSISYDGIWKSK